jgi:WD40 repeat protein
VWDASFSPDGARVLTSADDGTARIWNSDGRDQPAVLNLPADQNIVMNAAFSPDGTRILTRTFTTSHRPNDVRVWRVDLAALLSFLRQSTTACLTPEVRSRALGEGEVEAKSRFEVCETAKAVR